jgi:hypothetical protein
MKMIKLLAYGLIQSSGIERWNMSKSTEEGSSIGSLTFASFLAKAGEPFGLQWTFWTK